MRAQRLQAQAAVGLPTRHPRQRGRWTVEPLRKPHHVRKSGTLLLAHIRQRFGSVESTDLGGRLRPGQPSRRTLVVKLGVNRRHIKAKDLVSADSWKTRVGM